MRTNFLRGLRGRARAFDYPIDDQAQGVCFGAFCFTACTFFPGFLIRFGLVLCLVYAVQFVYSYSAKRLQKGKLSTKA